MLKKLLILAQVLLLVGFAATIAIRQNYANRAQLIQRVDYNADLALLSGEPGPPIGSPQVMIIDDPKAFIQGSGPEGAKLVDDNYLRQNGIYPLQLKTVDFVTNWTRIGLISGFVVVSLLTLWVGRRRNRSA